MKWKFFFLVVCVLSTQIQANEIIKHDCKQPTVPIPQASDMVVKYFNKHVTDYKKCIEKFVADQRKMSTESKDVSNANAAHDAAEVAIKEFNAFMEELNERNGRTKTDEDGDK